MAVYIGKIIFFITKDMRKTAFAYGVVLFLPTVIINSSIWGQCDVIYTAFVVMSLYYFLCGKDSAGIVLYAVAFSFKLQAIFVLPFIIIMILKGLISWKKLWLFPLAYFIMMLPAIIFGDNIIRILKIYSDQAGEYGQLCLSIANLWAFIKDVNPTELSDAAPYFAAAVTGVFMYYMLVKKRSMSAPLIVTGMAFFAVLLPFVLPHMHERYYYSGVVLTLLAVMMNKKYFWVLCLMEVVSSVSMSAFVFNYTENDWQRLAFCAAAVVFMLFSLYNSIADKCLKEE